MFHLSVCVRVAELVPRETNAMGIWVLLYYTAYANIFTTQYIFVRYIIFLKLVLWILNSGSSIDCQDTWVLTLCFLPPLSPSAGFPLLPFFACLLPLSLLRWRSSGDTLRAASLLEILVNAPGTADSIDNPWWPRWLHLMQVIYKYIPLMLKYMRSNFWWNLINI